MVINLCEGELNFSSLFRGLWAEQLVKSIGDLDFMGCQGTCSNLSSSLMLIGAVVATEGSICGNLTLANKIE